MIEIENIPNKLISKEDISILYKKHRTWASVVFNNHPDKAPKFKSYVQQKNGKYIKLYDKDEVIAFLDSLPRKPVGGKTKEEKERLKREKLFDYDSPLDNRMAFDFITRVKPVTKTQLSMASLADKIKNKNKPKPVTHKVRLDFDDKGQWMGAG